MIPEEAVERDSTSLFRRFNLVGGHIDTGGNRDTGGPRNTGGPRDTGGYLDPGGPRAPLSRAVSLDAFSRENEYRGGRRADHDS